MNVKKASSPYTIVRERDQSSAITLRRLFNLWAIFCCFTFAAGQSSAILSSTAKKSAFLDSTSGVSSAISAYSSHSVPINNPSENVSHTNTSSLKTGIITMLQSSNFAVTGSTEPIALALSFITTSTSVPSVPRSVRSLLDASSFSIAGFTEPLSLALFTSESLSSNESIASLSTSTGPSSSHVANASTPSHAIVTMSEEANASAAKPTFSNSIKPQNSSAFGLESVAASTPSHQSVIRSVASNLYQPSPDVSATSPQASTSTQSRLQSFTKTVLLSSAQNVSSVSRTVMYLSFSIMSVLSQGSSEVTQTSSFLSEASPVKSDTAISVTLSMSLLNFSSSATVSVLSVTQAPPYSIVSSGSLIQLSSKMHQSRITQAATKSVSEVSVGSVSTNESVSGYSANVTLSLNISSVIPTAQMPESSSLSSSTFRTTSLLSHSLSMDPSSFASYSTRDGSNSSVISMPPLQNESVSDSQYYSRTESRLAASQHISTSLPFLTASVVKTSFSAIDVQSKVQSSLTVSVRSMTIHSHALVSSYVLPQRFSSDKSSTDTRGALSTEVFSHVTPNVSFDVMQLSTAVLPDSLDTVYSLRVSTVAMSTSKYFFSSPLDYSVSTATQPSTTRSKASLNSSAAFLSKSSSVFTSSTLPIMHTAISSSVSRTMSVSPTKSVWAVNSSTVVKTASSFADLSISPGSEQLQPYSSRNSHKSTVVIPAESTSSTLHEKSSVTLSQSSSVITPERKLSSKTLAIIATSAPSYERTKSSHSIPLATTSYSLLTQSLRLSTEPNGTASTTPLHDTIHPQTDKVSRPSNEVLSFTRSIVLSTNKATSTASPRTDPTSDVYAPTSSLMHLSTRQPNVSSTAGSVTVTTSTSLASSFSFKPSTPELVFSSSVIAIPTGFFVRFVIRVDLNQNVSNASFVEQLRKGILEAYENGSADIALANVSVDIIQIARSPDANSSKVNVTFRVLNGSEPLLAYTVIQGISNVTLAEAVKYEVIVSPLIVYLPSSSASSMLMTLTMMPQTRTQSISQSSSEGKQSSSHDSIRSSFFRQSTSKDSVGHISLSIRSLREIVVSPSMSSPLSRSISVSSLSVTEISSDFTTINTSSHVSVAASKTERFSSDSSTAIEQSDVKVASSSITLKPSSGSLALISVTISTDGQSLSSTKTSQPLSSSSALRSSQVKASPPITLSRSSHTLGVTFTARGSSESIELVRSLYSSSDLLLQSPQITMSPSMALTLPNETLVSNSQTFTTTSRATVVLSHSTNSLTGTPQTRSTGRGALASSQTLRLLSSSSSPKLRSSEVTVSPTMTLLRATNSLASTPQALSTSRGALDFSDTSRLLSSSSGLIMRSSEVIMSPSMMLSSSTASLALPSQTLPTARGTLDLNETSRILPSSSVLAMESSEVSVSPSPTISRSKDSLPLNRQTVSTAAEALDFSETLLPLPSPLFVIMRSSEVTVSPAITLSRLRHSVSFTPQTVSTVRGALDSNETLQHMSSSPFYILPSSEFRPFRTLSSDSLVLSSLSSISTTTGSLYANETLRLLSSLTSLKLQSTEVNIRSQVSRVASSLPVLLRLSTDFMTFQSTSSSAASLSLHSLRTLNETAYQRPSSTDFIISPPTPSQESTLSPQPSPQRPLSTGFMSSHSAFYIATSSSSNVSRSLNDTRGVLHGTSLTSPFFSSLTSVQGSTLSLQSSPLKSLFTDTMPSQSASLMPRYSSFNLSSALHSSSSGTMKFPSLASSKESTLSTMMTLAKVSSSEVITASVLPSSFSMSTDISATPLISSMLLIATTRTRLSLTPTISGLVISSSPVIDTRTNFTLSSMFVPQSSPLDATSVVKPSGSDLSANMTNVLISTASKNATIMSIPTGNDSTPLLSQLTSLEASHTSRSRSTSHRTSLLSETSRISIMGRNTFGITSTYAVSRNIDSSSYFSFIRSGFVATSSFTSLVSYSVLIDATSTTPPVNRTSTTLNLSHTVSLITNNTTRSNATSTVKLPSQAAGNMSGTLGASLVISSVVGTTVAPIITQVVDSSEIRTADVTAPFSKVIFSSLSFPSIASSTVTSVIESLDPERTASRGAFKTSVLQTISSQSALLSSHSSKGFSKMDSFATTSPLHVNTSEITLPPTTFIVSSKESRAMSIDTSQSVTRSSIEDGVSSFLSLDVTKIYSSTRRIFSSTLTSVASRASFDVKPSSSLLTSTLNLLPSSDEFSKGKSIPFPTLNQSSMRTTDVDSSLKVDSFTLSFSYSMKVDSTLGTSIAILTKSGLLPSMTMIEEETSAFLEESSTYSTTGVSTRLPATGSLSSVAPFQPTLSFLPQARSSLFPMLPSSYKPIMTSTSVDISLQLSSAASRESLSFQTYMSASVFVSLPTTLEDATPSLTAARFSLVSKSSPGAVTSVEPTEPILTSKPNTTEGEGLVGIQILVPLTENETHPTFKENIERRLAAAYRWGLEKANTRAKRDVKWIEDTPVEPALMTWNVKNFNSWKQSPSFKVYEKRASRFRRQINNIAAVVEVIRRAKPIVGEEVVDIEYRMFDGSAMLSAEHIVKTLNRLSEAELVTTLKYAVTLRPYVVREVQVTPTPAASKWEILLPAIIVPSCIALFLLIALILAKCVSKRKRKQLIIKPTEIQSYETVEIKTLPPKNTKNRHGPPKKKRSSISSSSSSSSSDTLQRTPTLPVPDYSPTPTDTPKKPNQNYRRRTNGKYSDQKNITNSYSAKEVIIENKHVQHGRAHKKSKDTRDYAETDHPAGVLENRPQMRDERLVHNFKREEPPLRFTSLPPLVQTPLVGPKPSVPDTTADARTDYVRIIAESGVPQAWLDKMKAIELQNAPSSKQVKINEEDAINEDEDTLTLKANVERWRNKMRHREKLRQCVRDKEQEREQMLRQLEKERKEGNHQAMAEDQASSSQRSLTAERKRKSRLERWRKNRVGTSSSRSSSSDRSSSSSSSSSSSGSDSVSKKKHDKKERKRKKKQMRDKKKNEKVPSLATGHESKATAQEALRETAWTIKETPGVRLVSVKPITEQRRPEGTSSPTHLPPTNTQRDRIQYLLDTGYQMLPIVSTPVVQPFETQNRDDEQVYEDMDGLDPHAVQYGEDHYPPEPRHAFGGPSVYEDEHIYEEPTIGPSWLPQTHYAVSPRESQTRAMIPTQYARGYTGGAPMSRGRPTSASHPGLSRTARTRPTSARTDPMPRYAPSPGKTSPSKRSFAAPAVPGSRYMLSNQPTVATAAQPSIGTSPRYMVDPERPKDEPPSSFDGARMILSRAQTNINRFEEDSRRNILDKTDTSPAPASLYSRSPKRILVPASMTQKENSSTGTTRLDVAAREHAELEAQLLVSRALARARSNEKHVEMHSRRKGTMNVMQYFKQESVGMVRPVKRTKKQAKNKKQEKRSIIHGSSSSSSSSSSSRSSSDEGKKRDTKTDQKRASEQKAVVRPLSAITQ